MDGAKLQECLLEAREGLCLLRGGLDLAAVTRSISRRDFKSEAVLSDALKEVPVLGFDFVLIDTAPSFGPLNVNAFFFASEIVVPASLEGLTLHGLKDFLASVATIQEHRPELQVSHVVPTRYDQRLKASGEVLGQLRAAFGDKVASPIRTSSRLLEAAPLGKTIFEYAPASPGAQDYETLVDLVLAQ